MVTTKQNARMSTLTLYRNASSNYNIFDSKMELEVARRKKIAELLKANYSVTLDYWSFFWVDMFIIIIQLQNFRICVVFAFVYFCSGRQFFCTP